MTLLTIFFALLILVLFLVAFISHTLKTSTTDTIILAFSLITLIIIFLLFASLFSAPSVPAQPLSPAYVIHFSETPSPTSQQSVPLQQNHQLNKIIDALIGAGDFAGWANILSSTDPSTVPITATFFIPTNDAIATAANSTGKFVPDTFLIPYHIVPQRLTFDDLRKYPVLSKLPTLLPTRVIVVTNDSAENFTIDGTRITHPDLYLTGSLSVHGVMNVLDYAVYGNGVSMENGTLAKNDTKNEAESGVGVVSSGGFFGWDFWICVAVVYVVTLCFIVGEFSTRPEFCHILGAGLMLASFMYRMGFLDQVMST